MSDVCSASDVIRAAQPVAELLVDRLVARALDAAEFERAAVRLRLGHAGAARDCGDR